MRGCEVREDCATGGAGGKLRILQSVSPEPTAEQYTDRVSYEAMRVVTSYTESGTLIWGLHRLHNHC